MPEPQAGGDFTWPQQWGFNCLSPNPSTQLWSTASACRLICYCCSGLVIVLTTGRGASRAGLGLIHAAANCHQHPLHLGWKHLGRSPSDPINNLHTQLLNSQHLAKVRTRYWMRWAISYISTQYQIAISLEANMPVYINIANHQQGKGQVSQF